MARPTRPRGALVLGVALAAALAGGGCGSTTSHPQPPPAGTLPAGPSCIKPDSGKGCLAVAPTSERVDLARPSFSNPTSITNPLHPSGQVDQVVYGGQVDGKPFRTEFTRLPGTRTVGWNGQQIATLTWQYLAYSDGRIQEIALDSFAQADDGSVWYLGEDVADYDKGVVVTHEGTWRAGKDGPGAMIMPAQPKVGDVYRTENAPGIVFEEITVKAVGQTVSGPSGPIGGALVVSELHTDGTREDKVFARGYGEFSTGNPEGDLEQASLAIPVDARPGPLPAALATFSARARAAFDAAASNDWAAADTAGRALRGAWDAYRSGDLSPLLERQTSRDLGTLERAVAARRRAAAHQAALRLAQDDTDLRLRYRPLPEIERARLDVWARQLGVDAADADTGSVAGDVSTLELIRDRVRHGADPTAAAQLDEQLRGVRRAADGKDVAAAAKAVPALLAAVRALGTG